MPSLPLIDFSVYYNGTEDEKAQLALTIASELKKHGAMRLMNTRIPAEKIEEGFQWVSKLVYTCQGLTNTTFTGQKVLLAASE